MIKGHEAKLWEQIQEELHCEERYEVETERLLWILEKVHFDSPFKPASEEQCDRHVGLKIFEGVGGVCKSLDTRKKNQQLSQKEKVCIYALLKLGKTDKSHAFQNYSISRGMLMNICSELNREVDHWSNRLTRTTIPSFEDVLSAVTPGAFTSKHSPSS